MAFFPLLTCPPVFLTLLPSGTQALSPSAWVRPRRPLLHLYLVRHLRQLGRIPCPLLPSPFPSFLNCLLISLPLLLLFLVHLPSSPPCPRFSRHFTLCFFTFVTSHSVLCHVLSLLTSPVTMCLYVGLSSSSSSLLSLSFRCRSGCRPFFNFPSTHFLRLLGSLSEI